MSNYLSIKTRQRNYLIDHVIQMKFMLMMSRWRLLMQERVGDSSRVQMERVFLDFITVMALRTVLTEVTNCIAVSISVACVIRIQLIYNFTSPQQHYKVMQNTNSKPLYGNNADIKKKQQNYKDI